MYHLVPFSLIIPDGIYFPFVRQRLRERLLNSQNQAPGPSTGTLSSAFPTLISVESRIAGMRNAIGIQQALRKSVLSKRARSGPGGASIGWQLQGKDRREAQQTKRSSLQGKPNGKR